MPITLTVGTNTYVSLEDADTYHTTYANDGWTSADETTDEARKQALVMATQAVDLLYGARYPSYLKTDPQPLLFPRAAFYDNDGRFQNAIPTALKNAVCELALMYTNGEDIFPLANTTSNVKAESITVGGISISTQNYAPANAETYAGFNKVEIQLRPILKTQQPTWNLKA